MKQRFQVNRAGMLASRDNIFVVKVRGCQDVEYGKITALSLIKPLHRLGRGAACGVDILHPAIRTTVQDRQGAQGRLGATRVEPGQQLLEVPINGERLWLIHEAEPRAKRRNHHGPPATMGIAHAARDLHERPRVLWRGKGLLDGQPILTEALHKFHTHRHPTVETFDDQTTEHGIFLQQG